MYLRCGDNSAWLLTCGSCIDCPGVFGSVVDYLIICLGGLGWSSMFVLDPLGYPPTITICCTTSSQSIGSWVRVPDFGSYFDSTFEIWRDREIPSESVRSTCELDTLWVEYIFGSNTSNEIRLNLFKTSRTLD